MNRIMKYAAAALAAATAVSTLGGCEPVSYTHLDVYKRQVLAAVWLKLHASGPPQHGWSDDV